MAETIARPEDGDPDAPVCFVIMPFVEHDEDRYPVGFFAEVLEGLFTPAITAAALQVRTAERPDSDLIHSTIINELLQADLVLADLTEHNPNVLFELGMRIAEDKPVVLVRAKGTGRIFDVDHVLRSWATARTCGPRPSRRTVHGLSPTFEPGGRTVSPSRPIEGFSRAARELEAARFAASSEEGRRGLYGVPTGMLLTP